MGNILDWIVDKATKYEPVIKGGVAALSTYASWKDQQKKNQMQQAAYDDYMAQAAAAGHEAQAAIDINLTPMEVSGVPTSKADVTDFTAVAARGGLMSIPNKQRKRYARGPQEFEIEEMDEEVLSPFDLQQETGIDVLGDQVKYNTANPREGAWGVWNSGGIDQEIYEFDFEIFFDSGDWMDSLKGQVDVQEDTQMASDPGMGEGPFMLDEYLKAIKDGSFTGSYDDFIGQIDRSPADYRGQAPSAQGIMQAAKGGRIGYAGGSGNFESYKDYLEQLPNNDKILELYAAGDMEAVIKELKRRGISTDGNYAKGGRIKKAPGGIMDLGGLEKDYRTTGGFVPIGGRERADDVPARLSKNEFVMTADAVRAAGGGSINRGAQRMYDTMKHLEANPQSRRMTA